MFEDKCVWSALYPISNHSHIRQLQFATHAFSQQVLQQAVQISICQWSQPLGIELYLFKLIRIELQLIPDLVHSIFNSRSRFHSEMKLAK